MDCTRPRNDTCTWLRECFRQVGEEVISYNRNLLHKTMYKYYFRAQYISDVHCACICSATAIRPHPLAICSRPPPITSPPSALDGSLHRFRAGLPHLSNCWPFSRLVRLSFPRHFEAHLKGPSYPQVHYECICSCSSFIAYTQFEKRGLSFQLSKMVPLDGEYSKVD